MAKGTREKQVPRLVSYLAILAGVGLTAYLWAAGVREPRRYVGHMAVNHHASYGGAVVECHKCHVPVGGTFSLTTEMNCYTSGCHGEINPLNTREARLKLALKEFQFETDPQAMAEKRIDAHEGLAGMSEECWNCHREHSVPKLKDGSHTRDNRLGSTTDWVSVLKDV